MRIFLVVVHLLLVIQADVFQESGNCKHLNYMKQAHVSGWPGISIDETQEAYYDPTNVPPLNFFKCPLDTQFVYIRSNSLAPNDGWLACSNALINGWRYRNSGSRNADYLNDLVGCAKPSCTYQFFDGSESILDKYSDVTLFPTKPSLPINGKFTFSCPRGTVFGHEESNSAIKFAVGYSTICDKDGWLLKSAPAAPGSVFYGKFGCFKQLTTPSVPPAICKPEVQYFPEKDPLLNNQPNYQLVDGRVAAINEQWKLNCPADSLIGYANSPSTIKIALEPTEKITCESSGWTYTTSADTTVSIKTATKVGCFMKHTLTTTTPVPEVKPDNMTCGCWFTFSECPTCNWQKMFVIDGFGATSGRCTLGCAAGHTFEKDNVNMISCTEGLWLGSSRTEIGKPVPQNTSPGYLTSSCVPMAARPICEREYGTFECEKCDKSKLIPLNNEKASGDCVLSCDIGYRLLVQDGSGIVLRAQEVVFEKDVFAVYQLGQVSNTVNLTSACTKFTCEPATDEIADVKLLGPKDTPAIKPENMSCGCWYEFSKCPTCDWEKMFVLDGFKIDSRKCTLGCANGYVFDKYAVNMISCTQGEWYGSSNYETNEDGQLLKKNDGYLEASCVPSKVPAQCANKVTTFNCEGCEATKLISLTPAKSSAGCVLACDIGYRLVVADDKKKVILAQEVVIGEDSFFVYPLGSAKDLSKMPKDGTKFSCGQAIDNPVPPKFIS